VFVGGPLGGGGASGEKQKQGGKGEFGAHDLS
jgi:hypothetical protein